MIKPGDKIWEIEYDNHPFNDKNKRHIRSHTVKEYKDGIIFIKGTAWKIPFEEIGKGSYFLSRRACIMGAIKNNLKGAVRCDDTESISEMIKEVSCLCRMLKKYEE